MQKMLPDCTQERENASKMKKNPPAAGILLPFRAVCVEGPQNLMFVRPCVCLLSVRVSVTLSDPDRSHSRSQPI